MQNAEQQTLRKTKPLIEKDNLGRARTLRHKRTKPEKDYEVGVDHVIKLSRFVGLIFS